MKIFKQLRKGQNIKENCEKIKENYNCRNKNSCPSYAKCLAPSITYGAKIPSNQINCKKTKKKKTKKTLELGKQVSNTDLIISRNSAISKSTKMTQLSKEY